MQTHRTDTSSSDILLRKIGLKDAAPAFICGDNREIMRHSDGSLHAALISGSESTSKMSVFGSASAKADMEMLSGPIGNASARGPATDSNQNGVYIAFTQTDKKGTAGYIARIADLFEDGSQVEISGPLTPPGGAAENSFLQGSRGYNSVAYAWRDSKKGLIYAGVSKDGRTFPNAEVVVKDSKIVAGPAIGIFGDLVILTYQTADRAFAPAGYKRKNGYFYAYIESGDSGDTWSDPAPLVADVRNLPPAVSYVVGGSSEPVREEIRLSGASIARTSMQSLVWEAIEGPDKRVFALTTFTPDGDADVPEQIGVLTWKRPVVGAPWMHVLTNRPIFRKNRGAAKPGRIGQFKYCALPGSSVRVVAYVEKPPEGARGEDKVILLVSTNMGDSFDYEATFRASDLSLSPGADVVISNSACTHIDENGGLWQDLLVGDMKKGRGLIHAMLPVGINVQGTDPTVSW
jgi:hypothetical protein